MAYKPREKTAGMILASIKFPYMNLFNNMFTFSRGKKTFAALFFAALMSSTVLVYASDVGDCGCDTTEQYTEESYEFTEYTEEVTITDTQISAPKTISYTTAPYARVVSRGVPVAHGVVVAHPVTVAYPVQVAHGVDVAHPVTIAHPVPIATASSDYVGHAVDVAHAVTIGTITEVAHPVDIGTPAYYAYPVTIGTPVQVAHAIKI